MSDRRKLAAPPPPQPSRVVIHNSLAHNSQQHDSPFRAVVASPPFGRRAGTVYSSADNPPSLSNIPANIDRTNLDRTNIDRSNPDRSNPDRTNTGTSSQINSRSGSRSESRTNSGSPSPSPSTRTNSSSNLGASPRTVPAPASVSRSSNAQSPREMVYVDSKERLSEMVTNIRGISNSLANVASAVAVENVMIVSKLSDDESPPHGRDLVEWSSRWQADAPDAEPASLASSGSQLEFSVPSRSGDLDGSVSVNEPPKEPRKEPRQPRVCAPNAPQRCSNKKSTVLVEEEFLQKPGFGMDDMKKRLSAAESRRSKSWSAESPPEAEDIDLVITLGGDGTVSYTSWSFQKMVPPTISFGLGSLGFMTENQFENFPHILAEHLDLGICCASRMRFECTVMRTKNQEKSGSEDLENEMRQAGRTHHSTTHTRDGEYTISNEVVVDRGPNPFVTMTELYGNFESLTSIKADGVVISTPTGSTAYSMSAGGSLVHPDIPARLISPICPHTSSFRPLVVPDSMISHIGVPYDARSSAFVSFDGKARVESRRGDFLAINASPYPFPKVLPQHNSSVSWVQQSSRTLHWNEQKRPKRYTDGSSDNV